MTQTHNISAATAPAGRGRNLALATWAFAITFWRGTSSARSPFATPSRCI